MTTILQKAAFLRRISLFCAIGALAISCGSYHNASYAQDGIYNRNSHVDPYASNDSGDFYQEYFASLSSEAEYLTDISSYVSPMNDSLLNNLSPTSVGYGSWGQQPSGVKINIYNNTRPYSYWGRPYWGYGYYSPFYDPYYFGSGFGYGFSYGWGGYYGSWYAGGYWGSPYYNNYWDRLITDIIITHLHTKINGLLMPILEEIIQLITITTLETTADLLT